MGAKILVVDDMVETLDLMEITLTQAGYTVLKAGDGKQCLEIAAHEQLDLIILDLMMPELSGLDVLKQINTMYGAPPVIIFSAKYRIEDVIEGMEAGAFRYLLKPTSREKLLETVRAALVESSQRPTTRRSDDPRDW
ncbi:MAG: response regulator transcription factor [Anaerolineales bacterium]